MIGGGASVVQAGLVALAGLWALRVVLLKFVRGWVALEAAWLEALAARCRPDGWMARFMRRGADRRRQAMAQASGCASGCGGCRSRDCQGSGR